LTQFDFFWRSFVGIQLGRVRRREGEGGWKERRKEGGEEKSDATEDGRAVY
jgi:hypothetical protein